MRRIVLPLILFALLAIAPALHAGDKTHREWFREAIEASERGDLPAYASSMAKALEINTIDSNRPFFEYHLARARALLGDDAGALEALRMIWDEDIERLLVFYVEHDPAFETIRQGAGWQEIAARVSALELQIEEVRGGVYSIEGAGSLLLALLSSDGWLLVDSGYGQAADAIREALDTVSTRQVTVLVNTHEHEDHVGGNDRFGSHAIVVAHPGTLEVLSGEQEFIPGVTLPAKEIHALPTVMTAESLIIPAGNERVHVVAIPAHSSGDLAVVFEKANVIHMGDSFFPDQTERIFPGKDPERFLSRMEQILELSDDDTIVFSGHSPVVAIGKLRDAVQKTATIWDWTLDQLDAGLEGEALAAAAEEAGHPADWVEYFEKLRTEN